MERRTRKKSQCLTRFVALGSGFFLDRETGHIVALGSPPPCESGDAG